MIIKGAKLIVLIVVVVVGLSSIIGTGGGGGGGSGVNLNFTLESFVAVADLNDDGLNDIAVTKIHIFDAPPHPGYVSVLLQNPNALGSFLPVDEYPVGNDPQFVTISDINKDTFPDLIVANSKSNTFTILLQDPNTAGIFLDTITIPTAIHPHSIVLSDLNGDGYQDLAVCSTRSISLHFQDQNNPISFLPAENISIDPEGEGSHIAVGDINGNGLPDLVVSNTGKFSIDTISTSGGSVYVFLQDELSPGAFLPGQSYPAASTTQPTFVAINDFNKDEQLDLAVVNLGTPQDGNTASVSILQQDSNNPGAFLEPKHYATGFRSNTVAISDLDADGWVDLTVSNSGPLISDCDPVLDSCTYITTGSISVLFHNSTDPGNFLPAQNYLGSNQYNGVAIGDLNGDLRPDLAIAADGVPVLFQDPANPGQFLSATLVEKSSSLPP